MQRLILVLLTFALVTACSSTRETSSSDTQIPVSTRTVAEYSEEDIMRAKSFYIQGITAFEMQDFNTALDQLTMSYIIVPDDAGVNFALADAYMYLSDFTNAVFYATEAIDIDPANKWYHVKLAEIYIRDGQEANAVTALERATSYFPKDIDLLIIKAGTLTEIGEYKASNDVYERIAAISGPDLQLYFQQYRNYVMLEDVDGATKIMESAVKMEPDNPTLIQMLGNLYLEDEQYEKALELYEKALGNGITQPEIKIGLTDLYIQQGKWDEATAFIREMIEDPMVLQPVKNELMQFVMSQFMSDSSSPAMRHNTMTIIEAYSEAFPEDPDALALAADFYLIIEDDENALIKLRETVRLMPENEPAWRQLVQLYYSESQFEEIIAISDEAERWVPEDAFIRFFIGMAYSFTDDTENAISWLNQATEVPARPNFKSVVWGVLGDTYQQADNWPQAVNAYEEAIALDPDNSTALNNYAYYLSVRNENLQTAYEMSLRAVSMEPNNSSYLDTLGWIYFKKGNYAKAREHITAAIENGGNSATILEHMGDVYDKLDDSENALKWWEQAFEADPSRVYLLDRIEG
ncbi:MAG: tetratricopeptide repeat protein [Balneolales bacterium]|nr:tetratricopeptide repeat protein [Balneolales bacterium]